MEDCSTGDVLYFGGGSGVTKLFDQGIDGILSSIASSILTAAVNLFTDIASSIPTFGGDDSINQITAQLNWLVIVVAVASLLFSAARMGMERQGTAGIAALKGLVRVVLVAGAGTWVIQRLAAAGDNYTNYLYEAGVREQIKTLAQCGTSGGVAFLLILVGLLLLIGGIIHIILLYIRLGVMVVLTATLPLSAAASMTEWGSSWWRKHIAWLVAWLVFKPATALVIYSGTVMINATSDNATQQKIAGCGVLLLSGVALPALLRIVVPAAAALGSSDGAAGVGASAAGYGGKLATGAVAAGAGQLAASSGGAARGKPSGTSADKPAGSSDAASGSSDSSDSSGSGDAKSGSGSGSGDAESGSGSGSGDAESGSGNAESGSGSGSGDAESGSGSGSSSGSGSGNAESDSGSSGGSSSGNEDNGDGEGRPSRRQRIAAGAAAVGSVAARGVVAAGIGSTRMAAAAGRGTAGAVAAIAKHSGNSVGTAARHASHVVQGALPGVHDDQN
jgi:hypothetical protein